MSINLFQPDNSTPNHSHDAVLLKESVQALDIQADGIYLDATFGRGGHSRLILDQLGPEGRLIAIDRDPEALIVADDWAAQDSRFSVLSGSFSSCLAQYAVSDQPRLNGILFDLGVSSPQLDQPERGFSFQHDGCLDMRMDTRTGLTAAQWLQHVDEETLANCLYQLGEERFSRRISREIVQRRAIQPFERTLDLANCIAKAIPRREKHKHPATRSFQAIRMHINDEIGEIQRALLSAIDCLSVGGTLAVISFHSIEDRLVKQLFRYLKCPERHQGDEFPDAWLGTALTSYSQPLLKPIGKFTEAAEEETERNRRARSAKLRIAKKIAAQGEITR
ncbi:MAG: 16S rRNA (cytosine(1402)-N(4))-methyltransferase RsmH [Pseudomonadota bacterium]